MKEHNAPDILPFPHIDKIVEGIFSNFTNDYPNLDTSTCFSDVHASLTHWHQLDHQQAQPFLPDPTQQPVQIDLGIESLKRSTLATFEANSFDQFMKYKRGYIYNAGMSVWGLEFAPKTTCLDTDPATHYFAVGGYRQARSYQPLYTPDNAHPNCIQLVRCQLNTQNEQIPPILDLCLVHEHGHVRELKWCPYGAYEETINSEDPTHLPKLGLLACCFGDGSVRVLAVPHPKALRRHLGINDDAQPIYLQIKHSSGYLSCNGIPATTIAWANPSKLAIGHLTGAISVWNVIDALAHPDGSDVQRSIRFLQHCSAVHDAAVTCISWCGQDNAVAYVSCGFDCRGMATNITDPMIPMLIYRVRFPPYSVLYSDRRKDVFYQDADYVVRQMCLLDCQELKSGQLYGDNKTVVLSMDESPCHTFFSTGAADGFVKIHNIYIPKRIRGGVSFFFGSQGDRQ
ncbi:hypothetical protein DM01DRAFT_1335288 [Hesseltinella vesiculosa]|uniref:WD40 repeat-like protein n=1 Tax=Hesseltinella vesiculosa TaxID=101127 RepID=A0A1X2GJ16_9FUNG|nr:hypothetical protein DM01DRAFT_1335288 [Hesseltinella vesiculosa]